MTKIDCSGVYKIVNKVNGKIYIGSAVNFKYRWTEHKYDLNNNKHHSIHLQRSWNKYGKENFKFEILEIIEDIESLTKREQYYLDLIQCCKKELGYNLSPTAGSPLGYRHTEEAKKNMSEARKGKRIGKNHPMYGKTGKKSPNYGKKRSEESKLKMSGENNSNAKLTEQKVRIIRWLLKNSDMTQREIGEVFGVKQAVISDIKREKTWSHI